MVKHPAPFVIATTAHGTLILNVNDRHTNPNNPNDTYGVGYQLLTTGSFDAHEVDLAKKLLDLRRQHFGDGVVAVDCGANIGVMTVDWARHMTGWGSVVAIEAQERLFYALCGNIAISNCFNARAIHAVVNDKPGSTLVPFLDYSVPSTFGSLEVNTDAGTEYIGQQPQLDKAYPVPNSRIDNWGFKRLDFLKLDVEGMEMAALQGGAATFRRYLPIMIIETLKTNAQELTDLLAEWGYKTFPMGPNLLAIHESDPCLAAIQVQKA